MIFPVAPKVLTITKLKEMPAVNDVQQAFYVSG